MKAITLISAVVLIIAMCFVSLNIQAQEKVKYSNVEQTENGIIKEITLADKETLTPMMKSVYIYDNSGSRLETTSYRWDSELGWQVVSKYEYGYSGFNMLASIVYTKWNADSNNDKAERTVYTYNNGELFAVK